MGIGLIAVTALTEFSGLQTGSLDQPLQKEVRAEVPAGVVPQHQHLGWCCSAWAVLDTPIQLCSLLPRETRALQCSGQAHAQLHASA